MSLGPVGTVAVFMFPDGKPLCSASDFDVSGYGGFTLRESQEIRAKDAISRTVIDKLCSDHILKALDSYDCSSIMQKLIKSQGFRLELIRVGDDPK